MVPGQTAENLMTMNEKSPCKISGQPYEDLYIYYISGALDSEIHDKDFIGNWEEDGHSFLFFSRPAPVLVENLLEERPHLELLDRFNMKYDEWQGQKLESFNAGKYRISPPWEKDFSGHGERHDIILDPGVVFGNGAHPTTGDCLCFMERSFQTGQIRSALDLGTGTGLLALAAAKSGCPVTLAVDLNLLAVKTARDNIALNRLERNVLAVRGRAEEFIDFHADLLIANIHFDVMKLLLESEGFVQKKIFILSGLLRSQAAEVFDRLSQLPVKIMDKREQDGIWHTFFGRILGRAAPFH